MLRPKRPNQANGRTMTVSIASSKYHLLKKKRCSPVRRSRMRAGVSGDCTHSR